MLVSNLFIQPSKEIWWKLKIIFAFGLSGLLTTFFACHRVFLDPVPVNVITDSSFSTAARIANQVPGLYSSLKNGGFYGGRYIVYGDIRGEDFLAQDPNLVYQLWRLVAKSHQFSFSR